MPRPLRVFLCHSSKDKPAVRELYKKLLAETWIDPWLDEEKLFPGQDWHEEIEKAVEATDVVVVLLSKQSVSQEGFVQRELKLALDVADEKPENTIFIIPLRLDDCPAPRRLRGWHYVDYFPANRKDWVLDRLIASLKLRAKALGIENFTNGVENRKPDDVEQAEIARLAQEAKEKLERETAERVGREKLESARKAALEKEQREAKRKKQREFIAANSRWLGIGGIILTALFFGGFGLNYLVKYLPTTIAITNTSTFKPPTLTKTKIPSTMTPQPTVTSTSQPTKIATLPYGIGSTAISEKDTMVMVYVPDGKFEMGGYGDEGPIHQVDLEAFWIDQTEVTNAMYTKCVDEGVCDSPGSKSHFIDLSYADHPVVYVNWKMANVYCSWAGRKLPTEAEWEKAARGINGRFFPWGDDLSCDYANYYAGFGHFCVGNTTKVGSYERGKSIYGAYDMAGNVWEWVSSLYLPYPYDASDGRENLSVSGPRVVRGGSWGNDSLTFSVNSSNRYSDDPSAEYSNFGFRCALSQ